MKRVDVRNYPVEAVREALLNTVVHREYALGGSALLSVFDDRMEMVTLGGLPKGISFGDLRLGVSVPRNPRLADVFYRLNLIEAYGTGIPKIMESYQEFSCQPEMEISENAFRMTLPNVNHIRVSEPVDTYVVDPAQTGEMLATQYLRAHAVVSRQELQEALGLSQATAVRLLNRSIQSGIVVKTGQGKNTRYCSVSHHLRNSHQETGALPARR